MAGGQNRRCSDEEFVRLFTLHGATKTAKILNIMERGVYSRRRRLEGRFAQIAAPSKIAINHPGRVPLEIRNGTVAIPPAMKDARATENAEGIPVSIISESNVVNDAVHDWSSLRTGYARRVQPRACKSHR